MKQETRNKIGLLLFIFLFLMGGCLLVLYVFLGHNWNLAATEIDDVSGNMEEYVVVLYEGTTDPALQAAEKGIQVQTTSNTSKSSQVTNTTNTTSTTSAANATSVSESAETANASAAEANASAQSSTPTDTSSDAATTTASNASTTNATNSNNTSNESSNTSESRGFTGVGSSIKKFFSLVTGSTIGDEVSNEDVSSEESGESVLNLEVPKGLDMGDAFATYMEKNAAVLPLYTRHPEHYATGDIFYKGSYRIGVLGLTEPEPYTEVQKKVNNLYDRGATMVIVIAERACMLAAVDYVDIVIVTQGSTDTLKATSSNHCLYVESSLVGTIDAIIFSPNHIVSTKVL